MSNGRGRILIADDDPAVRTLLQEIVHQAGYAATTAYSGEDALNQALLQPFEVVLLDINLGDMSGEEVLRQIKRRNQATSVIMVTGVSQLDTAVGTMKDGAIDYVTKPFTPEAVIEKLGQAMQRQAQALDGQERLKRLEGALKEVRDDAHKQFRELVASLAREQSMLMELQVVRNRNGKFGKRKSMEDLPVELRTSGGSVETFANALLNILRSGKIGDLATAAGSIGPGREQIIE